VRQRWVFAVARPNLHDDDRIADGDLPIRENVCVEPATVDKVLDDPRTGHLLQVPARLAKRHAEARAPPTAGRDGDTGAVV
jgi:hypothetical protein